MSVTPEQIEHAILIMYGSAPPPTPTAQGEAIKWLLEVQETEGAWTLYPAALARSTNSKVQFNLANGIYSKVLKSWTRLSEPTQQARTEELWMLLQSGCMAYDLATTRRLSLALASATLQTKAPGAVSAFVARVSSMAGAVFSAIRAAADAAPASSAAARGLGAVVELLRGVAEELDSVALTGERRDRVAEDTRLASRGALEVLASVLGASGGSPLSVEAVWHAAAAGSLSPELAACTASALEAVRGWAAPASLSAGYLLSSLPDLWRALLVAAVTIPHAEVRGAAVDALESVLSAPSVPAEAHHEAALAGLVTFLLRSTPAIRSAASAAAEGAGDLAHPLSRLFALLLERETAWLCGHRSAAAPPELLAGIGSVHLGALVDASPVHAPAHLLATGALAGASSGGAGGGGPTSLIALPALGGVPITLGVALGDVLLQFAASAPLSAAETLLAAFPPINTLPTADRHPFYRRAFFALLLGVVADRVSYANFLSSGGGRAADGPRHAACGSTDEFMALRGRNSIVVDVLADCFAQLQGEYVGVLLQRLRAAHVTLLAAVPELAGAGEGALLHELPPHLVGAVASWQPLEAALLCLEAVAEDLCELLEEATLDAAHADPSFFENVVALVLLLVRGIEAQKAPPELVAGACRWLGGLAKWFAFVDLAAPMRTALLFAASSAVSTPGAAGSAVDVSLSFVPGQEVFTAVMSLLTAALQDMRPACRLREEGAASAARSHGGETLAQLVAAVTGASSPSADDAGLSDEDDDAAAEASGGSSEDQLVAACAAKALAALCKTCWAALAQLPAVKAVADALQSAAALGLPTTAYNRALYSVLAIIARLDEHTQGGALIYLLQPVLDRFRDMCASVASGGAAPSASVAAAQDIALVREISVLVTALRSPVADAGGVHDLGLSDMPSPGASSLSPAAKTPAARPASPLAFLVEGCWGCLETLMPVVHARSQLVACSLCLVQQCIRVSPGTVMGQLPSMINMVAHLYEAHLYPDALLVCNTLLTVLPMTDDEEGGAASAAARQRLLFSDRAHLSSAVAPFIVDLMRRLTAATMAAAARPSAASTAGGEGKARRLATVAAAAAATAASAPSLEDHPEAVQEYLRFTRALLDVCPGSVLCPEVLALLVPLLGFTVTLWERVAARMAADLAEKILTRPDLNAEFGEVIRGAVATYGPSLVQSLVGAMRDDRGHLVFGSVADMLRVLFETYGATGAGAAFQGLLDALSAEDATAAAAAAAEPEQVDAQSGAGCLTAADRATITALALHLARKNRPRFRMLLGDLAKLFRRQTTKDALITYLLQDPGATPDSEPPARGGRAGLRASVHSPAQVAGYASARVGRALSFDDSGPGDRTP